MGGIEHGQRVLPARDPRALRSTDGPERTRRAARGSRHPLGIAIAAQLLEGARAFIPDAFRGPEGAAPFGPKVDVPDDAPAADQLAGFLGRKV